jgi:hypothetical protein
VTGDPWTTPEVDRAVELLRARVGVPAPGVAEKQLVQLRWGFTAAGLGALVVFAAILGFTVHPALAAAAVFLVCGSLAIVLWRRALEAPARQISRDVDAALRTPVAPDLRQF